MTKQDVDLDSTTADNQSLVKDVTIDTLDTESSTSGEKLTKLMHADWTQNYGNFMAVPELHSAILMKSTWTMGKGYTTEDTRTRLILEHVSGAGKDTFRDVLYNIDVVKNINGAGYAEIIWDKSITGKIVEFFKREPKLLNLKPLNPGKVGTWVNSKGIIKKYTVTRSDGKEDTFKPHEMFVLGRPRFGDQILAPSVIKPLEKTILAMNESFTDNKYMMHHHARPIIVFKLKTDDKPTIDAFIIKMEAAMNKGNHVYVPDDKTTFTYDIVEVKPSQVRLEYERSLNNKFYRAVGVPLVYFGQAGTTESGGKMEVFAHETVFQSDQKYIEDQVYQQLFLKIDLIPPTSMRPELQADENKDAQQGLEVIQQNDVTPGTGR